MRKAVLTVALLPFLMACGVETASTAATVAAAKAKEAEAAKKTLNRVRTDVAQTERVLKGRAAVNN